MKSFKNSIFAASALAMALCAAAPLAQAASLGGTFTADNGALVYLSTSSSAQGSLIGQGDNWNTTFNLSSTALVPGQTYYLHVEATNSGGAAGFIGQFNLTGTGFQFSNGAQTLLTDTTHWYGGYNDAYGGTFNSSTGDLAITPQSWVSVNGSVASAGTNGTQPWAGKTNVSVSNVSSSAQWIWAADSQSLAPGGSPGNASASNGPCQNCTIDLTSGPITTVTATSASVPAPSVTWLAAFALIALSSAALTRRKRSYPDPA